MLSSSKKIIAGIMAFSFFLSGCGKAVEDSISGISPSVEIKGKASMQGMKVLENLPEGTFAFANHSTSALDSKAESILLLSEYFPEDLQNNFYEDIGVEKENFFDILRNAMTAMQYSAFVTVKQDEILFSTIGINPDRTLEQDICVVAEGRLKKSFLQSFTVFDKNASREESLKKIQEEFTRAQQEIEQGTADIPSFFQVQLSQDENLFSAFLTSNACDEGDKKSAQEFFEAVQNQDETNSFFSIDKAFIDPFLAQGNLAVAQMAIAEGEKQIYAEAEQNGLDVSKLKQLKKDILGPLQRMNITKMIQSLEKFSYVFGYLEGNMMDRESELFVKFSDEDSANLFAEIQHGKIPSNRLWLNEETKYTAKVSQNKGSVYDYAKYQNTEYPSVFGMLGGGSAPIAVITIIGIVATGATAIYSGSQEKARESIRQSDIQSVKTALLLFNLDNDRYPESLEDASNYLGPTTLYNPETGIKYEYSYTQGDDFYTFDGVEYPLP